MRIIRILTTAAILASGLAFTPIAGVATAAASVSADQGQTLAPTIVDRETSSGGGRNRGGGRHGGEGTGHP